MTTNVTVKQLTVEATLKEKKSNHQTDMIDHRTAAAITG